MRKLGTRQRRLQKMQRSKAKIQAMQKDLPKVMWGEQVVVNCWDFIYLGSLFEVGGGHIGYVRHRIVIANKETFWAHETHLGQQGTAL